MPGTPRRRRKPPVRKPNPIHRPDYARFREMLVKWRTDAGLSQRGLAERIGRSLAWVNRCETGGRRMDTLEWVEWVEACGVDPAVAVRRLSKRAQPR